MGYVKRQSRGGSGMFLRRGCNTKELPYHFYGVQHKFFNRKVFFFCRIQVVFESCRSSHRSWGMGCAPSAPLRLTRPCNCGNEGLVYMEKRCPGQKSLSPTPTILGNLTCFHTFPYKMLRCNVYMKTKRWPTSFPGWEGEPGNEVERWLGF